MPDVPATADRHRFASRWKNELHQLAKQGFAANGRCFIVLSRTDLYHSVTWKKRPLAESETRLVRAGRASCRVSARMFDWRVRAQAICRIARADANEVRPARGNIDNYNINVIIKK
jgi:hypothetical protein